MSLLARSLASRVGARMLPISARRVPALPRFFASAAPQSHPTPPAPKQKSSNAVPIALLLAAVAGGLYYYSTLEAGKELEHLHNIQQVAAAAAATGPLDYKQVAKDIAEVLDNSDYDDGSYGPLLVRLAWHASGTYSKRDNNGGSNGATMRFKTESSDSANNGLDLARNLLEPIKKKYPQISYGDLWTLAGVVAIRELGGPSIPWRPGRKDAEVEVEGVSPGRLPDAGKDRKHIREVFGRMGFDDRETVALIGAHALGRCHPDRSGFDGPWTFSPTMLTNDFFKLLLSEKWIKKDWQGPLQYTDKATKSLMMLPTDMELLWDRTFKKYTTEFANDEAAFHTAFSSAFKKLIELGVPFPADAKETIQQTDRGPIRAGFLATARRIVAQDSVTGLYRGLPVALLFSLPGVSTYLYVYDASKAALAMTGWLTLQSPVNHLVSATLAETVSGLFWTPLEVIKTRQQVLVRSHQYQPLEVLGDEQAAGALESARALHKPSTISAVHSRVASCDSGSRSPSPLPPLTRDQGSGATLVGGGGGVIERRASLYGSIDHTAAASGSDCGNARAIARQILDQEGVRGLFRGYLLALMVFVPYSIVYFLSYEQLKLYVAVQTGGGAAVPDQQPTLPLYMYCTCAAISGMLAAAVSNPLDRVKTIVQSREGDSCASKVLSTLIQEEGLWHGLTRGTLSRCLWAVPNVVVAMSLYEYLKHP
ncbi:heme peroxidase [Sorochytrium milnesiophthora]